jgi:hypothetical protein
MAAHVFAVWDFQCLLKATQRLMTCVEVPRLPTADREARRLINEIVLDEESDVAPGGDHASHFELYLHAMRDCGADMAPVQTFIGCLRAGLPLDEAPAISGAPPGVARFVSATMSIARAAEPHRVAAAFAYEREEIIPGMFRRVVDHLAELAPQSWGTFRYYLDRHIETDGDRHGPHARQLVIRLCGNDGRRWAEAAATARFSLEAREALWGDIVDSLGEGGAAGSINGHEVSPVRIQGGEG